MSSLVVRIFITDVAHEAAGFNVPSLEEFAGKAEEGIRHFGSLELAYFDVFFRDIADAFIFHPGCR